MDGRGRSGGRGHRGRGNNYQFQGRRDFRPRNPTDTQDLHHQMAAMGLQDQEGFYNFGNQGGQWSTMSNHYNNSRGRHEGRGGHMGYQQNHWNQGSFYGQSNQQPRLSAAAVDFVPKSNLSAAANEFVPRAYGVGNALPWGMPSQPEVAWDPLQELEESISTLAFRPGKFDATVQHLTEVFNATVMDFPTLQSIVDCIFEKSINDANFRYLGARMFDYFSVSVYVPVAGYTFQDVLLAKCQTVHMSFTELLRNNHKRLRNLTLFMADLFVHFGIYVGESKVRIHSLGNAVMDFLSALADTRDDENLKTVAQTLKMSGGVLEEDEKLQNQDKASKTPNMDALMVKISKNVKEWEPDGEKDGSSSKVSQNIIQMLKGLEELRKINWGMSQENQASANQQSYYAPQTQQATIREEELTEEEMRFIAEQLGELESEGDESEFHAHDDPEMTPEIEAAFEEFMKSQS